MLNVKCYYVIHQNEDFLPFINLIVRFFFRNWFDWFVYISLVVIAILHVVDIFVDSPEVSEATQNLFAIVIIFIWIRLMKSVRAFTALGKKNLILSFPRHTFMQRKCSRNGVGHGYRGANFYTV